MRLRRSVAVPVLLLVVASVACTAGDSGGAQTSAGSPEAVTIKWWTMGEDLSDFEDNVIAAFETANPGITVDLTAFPEANFGTKVETAIAAGVEPDVVSYPGLTWMKEGLLVPLDDFVSQSGIDLSGFNPGIVGTSGASNSEFGCSYGGKLYCLGSFTGAVVLLYNKDMFDAAGVPYPSTWPPISVDQFVADACKLSDPDHGVWGAAYGDPVTWLPWETFVNADGTQVTGYVNGPASVHVHEVLAKGITDGCAPTLDTIDPWEQGQDYFAQGKLAMVVGGFESLDKLEKNGINYGVAGLPTPDGVEPFFNVWSDGMAVFESSDHQDAALKLVSFLATEGQKIRAESGDYPLDATVAEEMNWAKGVPGRAEGIEVLKHARGAIFIPSRWDTFGPIFDAFGSITSREKSVQEALDDAAPAIQENLDKAWGEWNAD